MNRTPEIGSVPEQLGYFFYIISPNKTTFQYEREIPNYINDVTYLYVLFIVLEALVAKAKGKTVLRFNDGLTSMGHGIIYETCKLLTRGFELMGYTWLYERRFVDLDWSSPLTWYIAAIGVDFAYYWTHRLTHEVNLIWAAHQVHHSSEDYNLTTAIRQSMFQRLFALGMHQPLALIGVPLPAVIVHMHFNLLFQFWIHTEAVDNCGPLEWVFNTPSHHRVHHGVNKWCLDKNYAGVLIIWDRIFGTFESEKKDEKIVYGLVTQPQTFNVMWLQFFYFKDVINKARSMTNWKDTLKAIFYGPGWAPGTPRLGDPDALPDKTELRAKYEKVLSSAETVYILAHFAMVLFVQQILTQELMTFSWYTSIMFIVFILASVGNVGALYDGWWWAPVLEAVRCIAYLAYARDNPVFGNPTLDGVAIVYFIFSTLVWTTKSLSLLSMSGKMAKME